jgi:uncharacterized membrane protein YqjE
MSDPATTPSQTDPSVGELLSQLSEQTSRLVRDELALAKVEMTDKAKHAGKGIGLFGGAGVLAHFGIATLIATAILALDLVWPAWLAALVVGLVVLAAAAVLAQIGKRQVRRATPMAPEESIDSVKQDVEIVKEARHRDPAVH